MNEFIHSDIKLSSSLGGLFFCSQVGVNILPFYPKKLSSSPNQQ